MKKKITACLLIALSLVMIGCSEKLPKNDGLSKHYDEKILPEIKEFTEENGLELETSNKDFSDKEYDGVVESYCYNNSPNQSSGNIGYIKGNRSYDEFEDRVDYLSCSLNILVDDNEIKENGFNFEETLFSDFYNRLVETKNLIDIDYLNESITSWYRDGYNEDIDSEKATQDFGNIRLRFFKYDGNLSMIITIHPSEGEQSEFKEDVVPFDSTKIEEK